MPAPHRLSLWVRWTLGLFLLWIGAATAAPWLKEPAPSGWICSGGTLRPLVATGDGAGSPGHSKLECPACTGWDAAPARIGLEADHLPRPTDPPPVRWLTPPPAHDAAPLLARGPPIAPHLPAPR